MAMYLVNDTLLHLYSDQGNDSVTESASFNNTGGSYYSTGSSQLLNAILMTLVILGIAGNSSFLFVVSRVKTMRTLPNFYFVNLALADFLILISNLFALLWQPNSSFNLAHMVVNFIVPFLMITCLCVSLISVCMISLERYLAICHPYKTLELRQKFRVIFLLSLSWILGCVPGAVGAASTIPTVPASYPLIVCIFLLTSVAVVSLFLVVLFYTLIARETAKLRRMRALPDAFVKEEKRVVTLCMLIAALFFALVAPKVVVLAYNGVLIYRNMPLPGSNMLIQNVTWYLIIVHFCLNPILYNAGSQNHRRAFQMAFSRQSERSRRASTTRTTGINGNDTKHHNININVQVEENLM